MTSRTRCQPVASPASWMLLLALPLAALVPDVQAAPKAKVHTVLIEGMEFTPPSLNVNAGDTVIWTNNDPFPHTATAEAKEFDSRNIPAGGSWKMVMTKQGRFAYVCTLHPTMKGRLTVK